MKLFTTSIVCLFFITVCLAQSNPSESIKFPSPNAASIGKYGDIPISYHTGVPNISIPIHTISAGSLSVPVSLSYHSSGVRVDELASWVGLGWSLSDVGMITRSINGGPGKGSAAKTLTTCFTPMREIN